MELEEFQLVKNKFMVFFLHNLNQKKKTSLFLKQITLLLF
jgi:hypothetical protein